MRLSPLSSTNLPLGKDNTLRLTFNLYYCEQNIFIYKFTTSISLVSKAIVLTYLYSLSSVHVMVSASRKELARYIFKTWKEERKKD